MKFIQVLSNILGNILVRCIIILGLFIAPAITLAFKLHYPQVLYGWIILAFVCILAIERIWETFYSSRERRRYKLYGDWTLPIVSIAYIILVLVIVGEFFILQRKINIVISSLAIFIFIISFFLRLWGMRTLKDQWTVHAVGARKIKDVSLIREGPYRYIRHPIYLGVILEVLSMSLIWNTYFAFLFACLINVPLQLIRAYFEEKASIRKLGESYTMYKKEIPAFLPLKFLTAMKK